MQFGIVRPKMAREPWVQSTRQLDRINLFGVLKDLHNIPQFVKQPLVILLMRHEPAVMHDLT